MSSSGAFTFDADIGVDELLESPYFAFGTVMEIADHLRRCRETMEFSYWVVYPHLFDTLAPVLELLLAEWGGACCLWAHPAPDDLLHAASTKSSARPWP